MNKFCIITNCEKDTDFTLTNRIIDYINEKGCLCINSTSKNGVDDKYGYADVGEIPGDVQCAIILGGDGTIIHASHALARLNIPIVGVNIGNMGYLADTEIHNVYQTIDKLIADDFKISKRAMLEGKVLSQNNITYQGIVLNDIVVGRNGFSRIISLKIYVNDELMRDLRGDGVIISTPTGSTGYNLSANGPVVKPNSGVIIVTPICSHSLSNTSMVISDDDVVTIEVMTSKKTQEEEALASFDGNDGARMGTGDKIIISKANECVKLINTSGRGYFETLNNKFEGR